MLVARSPLRITLGGGGTDLKSYYSQNEGFLISAAINKYVFVSGNTPFKNGIFLKYSEIEERQYISEINHPIIREALKYLEIKNKIEITSLADIPAGTGLGSSGSFTVALLKLLYTHIGKPHDTRELAELACHLEIDILKEPIGKQDQFIAAYGGINCFTFKNNGEVVVEPLLISEDTKNDLEDNLLLFFTGFTRRASKALEVQNIKTSSRDNDMIKNLNYVKKLGLESKDALTSDRPNDFGKIMNEHWEYKKKRFNSMSNKIIDECYDMALQNGAVGGKLVGAGGGGFLMFYANEPKKLRNKMKNFGFNEVRFNFEQQGVKIVLG